MGSNPISSVIKVFIRINISSKEKKSIAKFLSFLSKIKSLKYVLLNQIPRKKTRKFVTVLKSPHVNKTAQEQFEFRFYNRQLLVFSTKPFLIFFNLKKINNSNFSGIKIQTKCLFEKQKYKKKLLSIMDPDNNRLTRKALSKKQYLVNYLNLLDGFGEISMK